MTRISISQVNVNKPVDLNGQDLKEIKSLLFDNLSSGQIAALVDNSIYRNTTGVLSIKIGGSEINLLGTDGKLATAAFAAGSISLSKLEVPGSGNALKVVRVKSDGTGFEYASFSGATVSLQKDGAGTQNGVGTINFQGDNVAVGAVSGGVSAVQAGMVVSNAGVNQSTVPAMRFNFTGTAVTSTSENAGQRLMTITLTKGIDGTIVKKNGTQVTASAQTLNFTGAVDVTDAAGTSNVQIKNLDVKNAASVVFASKLQLDFTPNHPGAVKIIQDIGDATNLQVSVIGTYPNVTARDVTTAQTLAALTESPGNNVLELAVTDRLINVLTGGTRGQCLLKLPAPSNPDLLAGHEIWVIYKSNTYVGAGGAGANSNDWQNSAYGLHIHLNGGTLRGQAAISGGNSDLGATEPNFSRVYYTTTLSRDFVSFKGMEFDASGTNKAVALLSMVRLVYQGGNDWLDIPAYNHQFIRSGHAEESGYWGGAVN